jgi:CelD/BcsL family acetyltransferase involved in cellulose biosynthesis
VFWLLVRPNRQEGGAFTRNLVPAGGRVPEFPFWTAAAGFCDPAILKPGPEGRRLAPGFWDALRPALRAEARGAFDSCALYDLRADLLGAPSGDGPEDIVSYLELDRFADGAAYLEARKPKMRASIRRALRRLEEIGPLELAVHGPEDMARMRDHLGRIEAVRRARFDAYVAFPGDFIDRLVTHGAPAGILHFSTLHAGGRPVSWNVGVIHDGEMQGLLTAFDPEVASASPGTAHFFLLIERLISEGAHRLGFGRGDHGYKDGWTDGAAWRTGGLRVGGESLASASRVFMDRMVSRARRIGRAWSPPGGSSATGPSSESEKEARPGGRAS